MTRKISPGYNSTRPDRQRALVLQGGGALGAYEVGVLKALFKKITQEDKENGEEDRLLFDIVAGTSIGAMNCAVLVGQFLNEKEKVRGDETTDNVRTCWKKAIDGLERFWREGLALKEGTTSHHDLPPLQMFSMFSWWAPWTKDSPSWAAYSKEKWEKNRLQSGKNLNTDDLASEEAARRYYSTKVFVAGAKKAFSFKELRDDDKFFDDDTNAKWLLLDDVPLKKQIEIFGKFPTRTSFESAEPRLLVTAVDIAEGVTVTFDSYKKSDGKRKTVYWPSSKYGRQDECQYTNCDGEYNSDPIVINYDNGITVEHVMASGTLPEFYEPKQLCKDPNDKACKRRFWDGGLLSNTPFRELLEAHRDYWVNVENQNEAPNLDVYIINVHPSRIDLDDMPTKYDEIKDRSNDILYGDRTYADQNAALLVTDYIDFIKRLKDLATKYIKKDDDKIAFEKEFESLKTKEAKSRSNAIGKHKEFGDLLKGRFELIKISRIERRYDPNTSTSFKTGDITPETIDKMIKEGERD
jgi:NTE family protein